MYTVKEVSRLSGVSVRTLHHYDAIGLLKPTQTTEAGYRLYDDAALMRLQAILLFRELEFPLRDIRAILDAPGFDPRAALEQQIHLLELRRRHINDLILYARQIQQTGVMQMDFTPFDKSQIDAYAAQARTLWGKTDAYRDYEARSRDKSPEEMHAAAEGLMEIFARIGGIRSLSPESPEAQGLIAELQAFISRNYYSCTKQILRGLGQMYAAGGSMSENIDAAGGPGTAGFTRHAIEIYCRE